MFVKNLQFVLVLCLFVPTSSQEIPDNVLSSLEEYRTALEQAAQEVLQQHSTDSEFDWTDDDDGPVPFRMPEDFMHSFKPNTGVGNREDLIIDKVVEFPIFDDDSFSKWRYMRFSNLDYILAMDKTKVVIWKKSLTVSEPIVFSNYEAFFNYNAGTTGSIFDAVMFMKRIENQERLYVALLTIDKASSISIYKIGGGRNSAVITFSLPFKTLHFDKEPANKLAFLESRRGNSLIVLVSNTNQEDIFYRRSSAGALDDYLEVHFPSAVDIVSFTVGGNGYIAVANKTTCLVYKIDEFARSHFLFERINFEGELVDLEHFRVGFSTYLLLSSSEYQALYVWKKGGFFEHQIFFNPNVVQAFDILLPNCRDDIVLAFFKYNQDPNLYVWNGQRGNFVEVSTKMDTEFLPLPNSMMSFSFGSTAYVMFVNAQGYAKMISIETHLSPIPDPILFIGKEVSDLMQQMQKTIKQQEESIRSMSSILSSAVRPEGLQRFTGTQVFNDLTSLQEINANINVNSENIAWEGSDITLEDYLAGTSKLQDTISKLEEEVAELKKILPDIVRVDEDAIITGTKLFLGDVYGSSVITQSLNVQTAAGINLPELQKQIYRMDNPKTIKGNIHFEKPLTVLGDLNVGTTINGISIKADVLTTVDSQILDADISFENKVVILGDLSLSGKVNGIDIGNEVVTLSGDHVISGYKNFQSGLITTNMSADLIDDVDINQLFNQALTVNGKQTITGFKNFTNTLYANDVDISGLINGYNFNQLVSNIVRTDIPAVITGHTVFLDDVKVEGSVTVDGTINGLSIPDDLFFVDRVNTVTGPKEFTGYVQANDVTVYGLVNGLNLPSDIITLSKDEVINGTFYFSDGITVEQDLIVNGLIDGVDVSELAKQALKIEDLDNIETAVFRGPVTVSGDLDVYGLINGVSFQDLIDNIVYKNERNVVIQSSKRFRKLIVDQVNLNGRINGYILDKDFITINGDQVIYGKTVFNKAVVFQDLTTASDVINGVNLTNLYQHQLILSVEDELDGDLEFVDHLIIEKDLTVHGTFGGLKFPDDLVMKSSDRQLSNKLIVGNVNVDKMTVHGNVYAQESFGGVNLEEFLQDRVTLSTDQEIFGDMQLGNVTVDILEIDGLINDININEFAENAMSLTKDQVITGAKEFSGITSILGPVTTKYGINGINISDVNNRAFKLNSDNVVTADIAFENAVTFSNLAVSGLINGINLTELDQDSVKKSGSHRVSGTVVFHEGFHVEGDIEAASVNGMNLAEDVLTLNTEQVISGTYTMKDVTIEGNLNISGKINDMDISEVVPLLAREGQVNTIHSNIIFENPIFVSQNIEVSGLVNGLDLQHVEKTMMTKSGNQDVPGHKILRGDVTVFGDVNVTFVNGVNWKEFLENVVRIDVPQAISGRKVFLSDLDVYEDIFVSGLAEIQNLNGVNLERFVADAVFLDEPAIITGTKVFTNAVEITGDLTVDLINGLDLKTDVVTLKCGDQTPQVITGEKTFQNVMVYGNVFVDGTVNGLRLNQLAANTLSLDGDQIITGHKTFRKPVTFNRNVYPATVNQMVLRDELITLHTEQTINSNLFFSGDVRFHKDLHISGLLNGVDVESLAKEALYTDTEQTIEGNYYIERAIVHSPVLIEGYVNGIDLNELERNVSNFMAEWNRAITVLDNEAMNQCKIAESIYSAIEGSYFALDGFLDYQIIDLAAEKVLVIPGSSGFSLVTSDKPFANIFHYKLDEEMDKFELSYQERIKAVEMKVYNFNGKTLAINIGVDTRDSYISLNADDIPISSGFSAGDALIRGKKAVIALLYENTCEIYDLRSEDSLYAKPLGSALILEGATSVTIFEMSGMMHVAISCDLTPDFAKESSKIYAWIGNDWKIVQNILASVSSKVVHFMYQGYNYLAFTNSVPVFESKESQAIQIYRNTPRDGVPFSLFQKLPFEDATTVELFEFGGAFETYMVVSNKTTVVLFLLEGEAGFKIQYTLHGKCITDAKPFILGSDLYIVVSQNNKESKTKIYKGLTMGTVVSRRNISLCS